METEELRPSLSDNNYLNGENSFGIGENKEEIDTPSSNLDITSLDEEKEGECCRANCEQDNGEGEGGAASCSVAVAGSEEKVAPWCNSQSLAYSHTVQLAELPILVVEQIVKNLDTSSKLYLRLTCRATKEWVETPKFLSCFRITINSNDEMLMLISYSKVFPATKWKVISFPDKAFTSYQSFPCFVSIFSPHITTLHMHHFNGGLAQILFLSSCETLENLRIDEMDLRDNPTLVIASDKMLKTKCPRLLELFIELKSLHIGIVYFNEVKQLSFYQTFLQRCKKLVRINVPRPQGPQTISWDALKGVQLKWIIGPISEYLLKKPVTNPIKTDIEVLDMDGLFSRHFPVVAEACVRTGAVTLFENVNEKHVKYLFTHEGDILQRILSLREKIDDRRPIFKWDRLQTLYVRSSRCDVRNEYPGYTAYPKLKKLTLVMDSRSKEDPNFQMLQRLVKLLVMTERTNLKYFILQWPLFAHDTPTDYIRAKDFCGGFVNLTRLHCVGWTVPDDDFLLIWIEMGRLKVVVLEECLNLTDFGLLGPSEQPPAIMNLKDLTRLEIRNRNNPGYLTDICFECAFMHMRLKYLLIESFHVSMKGYECLRDGELKWTIEKLPLPHTLPCGVTQEEFSTFIAANFPNILL